MLTIDARWQDVNNGGGVEVLFHRLGSFVGTLRNRARGQWSQEIEFVLQKSHGHRQRLEQSRVADWRRMVIRKSGSKRCPRLTSKAVHAWSWAKRTPWRLRGVSGIIAEQVQAHFFCFTVHLGSPIAVRSMRWSAAFAIRSNKPFVRASSLLHPRWLSCFGSTLGQQSVSRWPTVASFSRELASVLLVVTVCVTIVSHARHGRLAIDDWPAAPPRSSTSLEEITLRCWRQLCCRSAPWQFMTRR